MRRLVAQTRVELLLTLRRGESILLTFAIPVLLLAFFSNVDVLPTGSGRPVDFLFPCVLALAVMSTSMWPAPAVPGPPPPTVWPQPANSASPVMLPLPHRSNSAHPQKPPSSSAPQKSGLLQLKDTPACHVS